MTSHSSNVAAAMRVHLERLKALRGDAARSASPRLAEVKAWQTERLERTYADLNGQPRYRQATRFFVEDLYGPKDFSARDAALLRILPAMVRILPAKAVEAASLSIEVEALTEELDHRLAAELAGPLDDESYALAYRRSGTAEERRRQIGLLVDVGHRLDDLVHRPFVARTLKVMRQPARLAGLTDLQDFLERGFSAFEAMGGADEFLGTVQSRETQILTRLFSGEARPFSV